MREMPASVRPILRRLQRRLAIGLFVDVWRIWATASVVLAGLVALVCRLLIPDAAAALPWLWLAPVAAALPALVVSLARAYRPAEVVALADWLSGGHGMLLALLERHDPAWTESRLAVSAASALTLPRFNPWRRLMPLLPAVTFLAIVLLLPQRHPALGANVALADDIAADLTAALATLQQQDLITPAEEERLEEEIERIRRSAEERVDASSWEAADALREQMVAGLSAKQDALKWAEDALSRYAAAGEAGASGDAAQASAEELAKALEALGKTGLLAGASSELQQRLAGGKLALSGQALREFATALAKELAAANGRLGKVAALGQAFGRFDPSEFPLAFGRGPDGDGPPGRGGINRGRGDAPLTWGRESQPLNRFKAQALPPGAVRSPDDWAPVVVLPGAPEEAARLSAQAEARQYDAAAGQAAWRRSLAPRHQSAVRKYFEK
jgi:hypothetical protein